MRILPEQTSLIICDIQEKLCNAMYETEKMQKRAAQMACGCRLLGIPIFTSQQYTKRLGLTVAAVREASGSDSYFEKSTFSCMRNEAMADAVRKAGRHNVIIIGTETHVCVLQTAIDLKEEGFQPILAADAVASRYPDDKEMGLRRAMQEGVLVTTSEAMLFELLQDSKAPQFKEISKLVKDRP